MKIKITGFILLFPFCLPVISTPAGIISANSNAATVILSLSDDAYYSLAEEIAAAEALNIYASFEEAIVENPVFLLWVIAPQNLSEEALLAFSAKVKNLPGTLSTGIITGENIDDARSLWFRSRQHFMPAGDYTIINGNGATQKVKPEIVYGDEPDQEKIISLTSENWLDVLSSRQNVQVTVEGTAVSWFDKHADITLHEEDIPRLDDTIILHYGCSTFRPWVENSIVNACINQGALAYMGFVFPSIVGTRFGDYNTNGLLYTWEKFPLGHLTQIQNQASMQSYADLGHFFMIGDPRIYRQSKIPYTLVRDESSGSKRLIKISDVPAGLIPVYIPNGAIYDFVVIDELTSSGMKSRYFNRYMQMMNINQDKFIMIENKEKHQDFITIELSEKVPLIWKISSSGLKFIDTVLVDGYNNTLYIPVIALIFGLMLIRLIRKRINRTHLLIGAGFGLFMVLAVILLSVFRINHIEITNISVDFNWLFLLGIFISTTYGLMLYLDADKLKRKIPALLITNLNSLITLLIFLATLGIKLSMGGNGISMEKISYPWLFPLQKLILGLVFYTTVFILCKRLQRKNRKALG